MRSLMVEILVTDLDWTPAPLDKDLLGKQQQHDNHEIDYAAFHTETGYFTGPIFMRTWSELPVDWSWELLHALFCACAAYIQISFITGVSVGLHTTVALSIGILRHHGRLIFT